MIYIFIFINLQESESADDFSENEDAQAKASERKNPHTDLTSNNFITTGTCHQVTGQSNLEENIITTTIIGEERIHYEPSGVVSETILDSVVEARNGDNFNQHYEGNHPCFNKPPRLSKIGSIKRSNRADLRRAGC